MKHRVNLGEFSELKEMGYKVHMFTDWHYRVSKTYSEDMMDIYPTRKTYVLKTPTFCHNKISYDNLLETVERTLK